MLYRPRPGDSRTRGGPLRSFPQARDRRSRAGTVQQEYASLVGPDGGGIAWSLRPFRVLAETCRHHNHLSDGDIVHEQIDPAVSGRARRRDQTSRHLSVSGSARTREDRNMSRSATAITLALLGGLLTLSGCASVRQKEAADTGGLLTAAGFQQRLADSPERLAHLRTMSPLKLGVDCAVPI